MEYEILKDEPAPVVIGENTRLNAEHCESNELVLDMTYDAMYEFNATNQDGIIINNFDNEFDFMVKPTRTVITITELYVDGEWIIQNSLDGEEDFIRKAEDGFKDAFIEMHPEYGRESLEVMLCHSFYRRQRD